MLKVRKKRKGFTLLEMVLTTAGISIIASVVVVAVNPQKSLLEAKNSARLYDMRQIESGMMQVLIDARNLPDLPFGKDQAADVCRDGVTGSNCTIDNTAIDLSLLAPTYMVGLPVDPDETNQRITGYRVYRDGAFYHACSPRMDPECGGPAIDPACGNNTLDGAEECDDGPLNGQACTPENGATSCTYCSFLCRRITVDNAICGNGVVEGSEVCDDGDRNGEPCETVIGGSCTYCTTECDLDSLGDTSGGGDSGGGNCAPSDCIQSPPMAASYPCADGSYAGPACTLVSGQCQWTINTCPENDEYTCTPATYAQQRVLALWLDTSSPEVLLVAEDKSSIDDGDPVMLWNDRYTSRNDVIQGTASQRPTYVATDNAVSFDGIDDILSHYGNVTDFEGTAFIVFKNASNTNDPQVLMSIDGRNDDKGSYIALQTGIRGLERGIEVGHYTKYGYYGANNCLDVNASPHYLTWEYSPGGTSQRGASMWLDGKGQELLKVGEYTTLTSPSALHVGGLSSDLETALNENFESWQGQIMEVIVFREKLKNSERQCLDRYLQEKWGIADGVASGDIQDCVTICCGPGGCDCGNGTNEPGEDCDDGNLESGDGCSPWCTIEQSSSSSASTESSQPYDALCGNGIIDVLEQCDDGNHTDGDGCSLACISESMLAPPVDSSSSSSAAASSASSAVSSVPSSTSASSTSSVPSSSSPVTSSISSSDSSSYFDPMQMGAPGFPYGP